MALTLSLILVGCGAGVPSKASVNVRRIDDGRVDQAVVVTLGPRRLLEKISKEIIDNNGKIEIVDSLLFRDTAFPEGDWSLQRLLEPEVHSQVAGALNVDYLILVGSSESTSGEGEGFILPMVVGAGSWEESTKISAVIIELKRGGVVTQIESIGSGTGHLLHYVIFVVGNEPQTATGAIDGLAKEIGNVLVGINQSKRIRIAVMAIEPMDKDYASSARRQSLQKQFNEGNDSYELKVELARLGDSEPLKTLANEGDKQASIDLYEITGISAPLYRSAEKGDPEAKDIVDTIAEEGSAEAQFQMYMRANTSDPLVWLCRAADQEYGEAMVEVGNILWEGRGGIARDRELARCWYKAAVDAGHGDAKSELMAAEWMLSGDQAASTDDRCTGVNPPSCEKTLLSR